GLHTKRSTFASLSILSIRSRLAPDSGEPAPLRRSLIARRRRGCCASASAPPLLRPLSHVGTLPSRPFLPSFRLAASTRPRRIICYGGPLMAAALPCPPPHRDFDPACASPLAHAATCRRSARAIVVG